MSEQSMDFGGLRVAAFESRRCAEMARLIERHGGVPFVSPSMRELPLESDRPVAEFAQRLLTGDLDIVVFLTGVGFRQLLSAVERLVDRQRFLDNLADITTVARGPKVTAAMREAGLSPKVSVAEPHTWREVLLAIDAQIPVANQTVAVQEYGETNPSLIAGLEARGARVLPVLVYRWDLPEDPRPLEENVRATAGGQRDVLLFTSAHQLSNVRRVADSAGLAKSLRERLGELVVGSVGPTTSEMLRQHQWPVDIEPEHAKMGALVLAAARSSQRLLARKRQVSASLVPPPLVEGAQRPAWYDSPFLRACRRERCEITPVWLMRQAGRYMAEYRAIRTQVSFLDLCKNPALCSEVMCTAVRRLGVDAAIVFSDLLPLLEPMGLELEFPQGEGPVIHNPVRESADIDRVLELESVDSLGFVMEAVRQTRRDLPERIPLIGFAGAPFTLASYVIEGGASRNYLHTKTLMLRDPGAWQALMERFVRAITRYLNAQVAAGAQCVQLFDSWVGCLGPDDYRSHVLPHVRAIVAGIAPGVPVINFATGNPALTPLLAEAGSAVVGVDWRIRLDDAWRAVGGDLALQGNLDPAVLLTDREEIRRRVREILGQAAARPGHIFNLGHGVLPQTPVDHAAYLVDAVHELSQR